MLAPKRVLEPARLWPGAFFPVSALRVAFLAFGVVRATVGNVTATFRSRLERHKLSPPRRFAFSIPHLRVAFLAFGVVRATVGNVTATFRSRLERRKRSPPCRFAFSVPRSTFRV